MTKDLCSDFFPPDKLRFSKYPFFTNLFHPKIIDLRVQVKRYFTFNHFLQTYEDLKVASLTYMQNCFILIGDNYFVLLTRKQQCNLRISPIKLRQLAVLFNMLVMPNISIGFFKKARTG